MAENGAGGGPVGRPGEQVILEQLLAGVDFARKDVVASQMVNFVYLVGDNPMHLRSVLKDSPVWDALVATWRSGAVVAAVGGASRVLCDPMVDPRGGAFAVGLGLLPGMALIPHHEHWSPERAQRTLELAPPGLPVVAVDDATALIRDVDGGWRVEGVGEAAVFVDARPADLSILP